MARRGEMFWFHSVTVGDSVFIVRNKLHIIWKIVNYFLNTFEQIFLMSQSFDEKKNIFLKTKWSVT